MFRSSRAFSLAAVLVLTVAIAGCSSDKGSSDSAAKSTTTVGSHGAASDTTTTAGSDDDTTTSSADSGSGGSGGGDPLTNPCALVTPKQVATATSAPYTGSELQGSGPSLACFYTTTDQQYLPVQVAVTDAPDAQTGFDAQKGMTGAEAVDGLGDAAFWFGSAVHVEVGEKTLMVTVNGLANDPKGAAI